MIQKNNKNSMLKTRLKLLAALLIPVIAVCMVAPVHADSCQTSILPDTWCDEDNGLTNMIVDIIWILSLLVWILGGVFIVICGVMWMTAADDPGKVANAKKRILEISIGILAFVAIDVVIKFLGIGS